MYTSASLAMRYGANIEKAMTAGLLHDCGKYCSAKEQLKLCEKYKITLTVCSKRSFFNFFDNSFFI